MNYKNIYFTAVSTLSIIAVTILFGSSIYHILINKLISHSEYIHGYNHTISQECNNDEQCAINLKKSLIQERILYQKEAFFSGLIRGILFFILFIFHYPQINSKKGDEKKKVKKGKKKKLIA